MGGIVSPLRSATRAHFSPPPTHLIPPGWLLLSAGVFTFFYLPTPLHTTLFSKPLLAGLRARGPTASAIGLSRLASGLVAMPTPDTPEPMAKRWYFSFLSAFIISSSGPCRFSNKIQLQKSNKFMPRLLKRVIQSATNANKSVNVLWRLFEKLGLHWQTGDSSATKFGRSFVDFYLFPHIRLFVYLERVRSKVRKVTK